MSSTEYIRGSSLAEFFLKLLQAGRSVSEMKASLDQRIRHGVITVVPSLPASWRLRPMGFDGFMIETRTATSTPANSTVTTGRGSPTGSNYLSPCKPRRPKPNTRPEAAQSPGGRARCQGRTRSSSSRMAGSKAGPGEREARPLQGRGHDEVSRTHQARLGPDPACRAQGKRACRSTQSAVRRANQEIIIAPIPRTCSLPTSLVR